MSSGQKKQLYRATLEAAGYGHNEPTEENVRACFMDYVDCGYWANLTADDIEDIEIIDICRAMLRFKGLRVSEVIGA